MTTILTLLLLSVTAVESMARETITMYLGEVQVLEIDEIERVAIGNPSVVSNSILPQGQLVLLADSLGATTMHIWLKDGHEKDFDIVVKEKKDFDDYEELVTLLNDFPGISTARIGELTVIKGKVHKKDKAQYDRILQRYKDVLDLVTARDTRSEVSLLLEDIPNLTVREVGGFTVLSGEISEEFSPLINIVEQKYQNILNMTRIHTAVAGKMIYMKVTIMELNKRITENLGIDWSVVKNGMTGPSLEFGVETSRNSGTILNADSTSKVLTTPGGANLTTSRGYFGIATNITSIINLSLQNNDGVILAEPQLSTRSGGKAEFHAGGEYPIVTTSTTGQVNVEYKKYGIMLNIEPVVDDRNNILAHLETEISNIDPGQSFGSYTGLLTRNTSTDVSLREGETLVIAGLVQNLAHKDYSKVAGLGDIPILGPLFRSKDFQNQRTELVIFVTPQVYDASSPLNANRLEQGEKVRSEFDRIVKDNELFD
ncbi:MAG: pilus assembly protein N-terminal domain-containing protein [Desulfobulbaceae bacterium]|nr:pilus assembly protein N-terminal domain-containing protein [Desulfobulbaceae bacterium]